MPFHSCVQRVEREASAHIVADGSRGNVSTGLLCYELH